MDRICPNCKTKLGGNDHFFCTSCGFTLDEKLINRNTAFKRIANFAAIPQEKPKPLIKINFNFIKAFSPKIVIALVLVFTCILSGLYVYKNKLIKISFGNKTSVVSKTAMPEQKVEPNRIISDLQAASGNFQSPKLLDYVPFDAKIVVMGSDLNTFGHFYEFFDGAYTELISFLEDKVEPSYVFFANSTTEKDLVWSLIVLPNDESLSFSSEILANYDWIRFWKNVPILLMTPDETILTKVAEAKSGTAKNFTHTTQFASSKFALPSDAKLLIYVTEDSAQAYLTSIVSKDNIPDNIALILQSLVKSKLGMSLVN